MTREEMTELVKFITIMCPQQKMAPATTVAWYEIIGHLSVDVARNAVVAAKHSQAFVDASDIIREAERALHTHAHPYERTVADAIGQSSRRELTAAPATAPTYEYVAAKADMDRKQRERDQALYLASREAQRRANDWIAYKLSGQLPPNLPPLDGPVPSQFVVLPDDPPELRVHLARKQAEAAGGYPEDWPKEPQ